jgi:uncharacterized membrane protein YoaK (UPF0700 family)
MLLLIAVAGGLDATAFLGVGGVFVANQTGNATLLAMAVAGTHTGNTAAAATSLVCFFVAAALGGRLLSTVPSGERWPSRTSTGIAVEVALVLGGALLARRDAQAAFVIGPLAIAMGLQGALAARLALEHLTGGFITGATTTAAMTSPVGDGSNPWWWYVLAPITVLAVAAGSISVVADHTVPGALFATALLGVGAWLLSRDRVRRAARA